MESFFLKKYYHNLLDVFLEDKSNWKESSDQESEFKKLILRLWQFHYMMESIMQDNWENSLGASIDIYYDVLP